MRIYLSVDKPAVETTTASAATEPLREASDAGDEATMNQYAVESPHEPW
jgi:hypothetical protein